TWGNEVYGFSANYFVAERLGTGGLRHSQGVGGGYLLNNRGSDSWDCNEANGARPNCGMKIDSFFVDAREAVSMRGGALFGIGGADNQITNGRIWFGSRIIRIIGNNGGTGSNAWSGGIFADVDIIWDKTVSATVNSGEEWFGGTPRWERSIVS